MNPIEHQIRDLSKKLATSWLLPVQTGIDDQQAAAALKNARVLVTIASKSGDVLEPTYLTLSAPGVSPVGFVQISPRVYLASGLAAGEYQLAWQLTPKSVVQRVPKITIPEQGCVVCEVVLGTPEPKCTTKTVDAIVLPHRSSSGPTYNLSITEPLYEAMTLYHEWQGWKPYVPLDDDPVNYTAKQEHEARVTQRVIGEAQCSPNQFPRNLETMDERQG